MGEMLGEVNHRIFIDSIASDGRDTISLVRNFSRLNGHRIRNGDMIRQTGQAWHRAGLLYN